MAHRRLDLILIGCALLALLVGAVVRVTSSSHVAQSLGLVLLGMALGGLYLLWAIPHRERRFVAEGIRSAGGTEGFPCGLPTSDGSYPWWGTLVRTPDAWIWEPNARSRAAGRERISVSGQPPPRVSLHHVKIGPRILPAATLVAATGETLTVFMSRRNAAGVQRMLDVPGGEPATTDKA